MAWTVAGLLLVYLGIGLAASKLSYRLSRVCSGGLWEVAFGGREDARVVSFLWLVMWPVGLGGLLLWGSVNFVSSLCGLMCQLWGWWLED